MKETSFFHLSPEERERAKKYDESKEQWHVPSEESDPVIEQMFEEMLEEEQLEQRKVDDIIKQISELSPSCREELQRRMREMDFSQPNTVC